VADENPSTSEHPDSADAVWTYRGYRIKPGEFTTAMVHFYRAEVSRSNVWRSRLDATTNWAVITTGAALTFAFGEPNSPHLALILTMLLSVFFLYIEARRYRYYELWANRTRMMETDFFAAMLVPPFQPSVDWPFSLADNLVEPRFPITFWEALGRRYRRNYFWLLIFLAAAWFAKIGLLPTVAGSWEEFCQRAAIGELDGRAVLLAGVVFNVLHIMMGILTAGLRRSTAEVLPDADQGFFARLINGLTEVSGDIAPRGKFPFKLQLQRDRLAFIITERGDEVAEHLLHGLKSGVTALKGTGMYTGEQRDVLLCAVRPAEIKHLKTLVHQVDPDAFVVVSSAQEVVGGEFSPL
jgi:uncharacterized membrane protein